jgi:hypothetical protein
MARGDQLVDYVETRNLEVLRKERKAFLQDEEKARELRADNERHGYNEESPLANTLHEVFQYPSATGGCLPGTETIQGRTTARQGSES